MKAGRSLMDLAAELQRQATAKKDFLADTRALTARAASGGIVLDGINGGLEIQPTAHAQLADALAIPRTYYDRLLTASPDLLAENVNHWLHAEPARKLVRTLDGKARAFLSDRYRPLDNFDLWACLCLLGDYLERCCGAPEALALPNTTDDANLTPLFRSMNALQDTRDACCLWQADDATSFVPEGVEAVLHSCWIALNSVTRPQRSRCSRCDQDGGVRRDRPDSDDELPRFHCKRCSVPPSTTQAAKE